MGLYVAVEGIDGAGKTTLVNNLHTKLRAEKHRVLVVKEPSGTVLGRLVRLVARVSCPRCIELLFFMLDRLWQYIFVVAPHLLAGFIVLSDRSIFSTLAYQSAQGLNVAWLEKIKFARPHAVILLDLDVDTAMERLQTKKVLDKYEQRDFLARVRLNYLQLAEKYRHCMHVIEPCDVEQMTEKAFKIVVQLLR